MPSDEVSQQAFDTTSQAPKLVEMVPYGGVVTFTTGYRKTSPSRPTKSSRKPLKACTGVGVTHRIIRGDEAWYDYQCFGKVCRQGK